MSRTRPYEIDDDYLKPVLENDLEIGRNDKLLLHNRG